MIGTTQGRAATPNLSRRDLGRALSFLGDLVGCESAEQLTLTVRRLRQLVGAEAMIIGTVERCGAAAPVISAEDDPPGWFDPSAQAVFARFSHQQPLVSSHFAGMARRAEKVSDFLTGREWHGREIYNDFYRRYGLGWEIAAQIHASPRSIRCAAIQRASSDFSERDRELLDLIAPHLRAAYSRVSVREEAGARLELLERGLEERGEGAALVDRGDRLVAVGPRARRLLAEWFEPGDAATDLPDDLAAWLKDARAGAAAATLNLVRAGRRLRIRLVCGDGEDLIVLTSTTSDPLCPAALAERLPISPREAEVLALLATGRANAAIAGELGISAHTVARHVERLYLKLGVQNRAGATAAAFGTLV